VPYFLANDVMRPMIVYDGGRGAINNYVEYSTCLLRPVAGVGPMRKYELTSDRPCGVPPLPFLVARLLLLLFAI